LPSSRAPKDLSVHTCPHCPVNMCLCGSPDIFINDLMAHRRWDCVTEFCGVGTSITGSPDVFDDM